MALIELDDVTLKREGRIILDRISLKIAPGMITAIMGSSGSGKSTLLNLMTGRLQPTQGSVKLFGIDLSIAMRPQERLAIWRRVGFLFQSAALFSDLSVIDNVKFPISEHTNLPERLQTMIALMKLESVGLRAASDYHPHQLSGGMQRRVALARAISLDPEIVFYDEPFAGQDPISMGVLVRLIQQFTKDLGMSSLVVSHDVGETLAIADRVIFLHESKIHFHGTAHEFVRCQDPGVVQFVQALADGPVQFHMQPSQALGDQLLCLE